MKKVIFLACSVIFFTSSFSQPYELKKYSFSNPQQSFSQTLILKSDSSFEFLFRIGLIKRNVVGKWQKFNNVLFLINSDTISTISVKESKSNIVSNNSIKFKITNKTNDSLYYKLYLVDNNDKKYVFDNTSYAFEVPIKGIKYFQISSVNESEKYYPQNNNANFFEVLIRSDKFFVNPFWLVKENKIFMLITKGNEKDDFFLTEQ